MGHPFYPATPVGRAAAAYQWLSRWFSGLRKKSPRLHVPWSKKQLGFIMRYAMVCLYIYILYMMWFLPAIACMQTEKGTSRSHHTSGNLQRSTIRSQILTYGNDVMQSAAGSLLDLGIWSGTLSSMYRFELTFLNSQIYCFTVLTHQHALWLCTARSRPPREAQYPISRSAPGQQWWQIGGIAAFARKIPSLCCSVPCLQSTMRTFRATKKHP